jgi:rare lipoprotein A
MERALRLHFFVAILALTACAERQAVLPQPVAAVPAAPVTAAKAKVGEASIYAQSFAGKTTASGTPLDPSANVVASNVLPLGSTAKVTNLQTGRSAIVTVQDRGRLRGRIVDLTPGTANRIGLSKKQGIAPVSVEPVTETASAQP